MSGPSLPVNVDTTYADDAGDASVKTHQQHHDLIHPIVNRFDKDATPAAGDAPVFDGVTGLYLPTAIATAAYIGTFAGMPAASANDRRFAFATDINGGTLYISNGTTWLQVAASVLGTGGAELGSANLTADYSIFGQAAPTTFTDIGLSVAIGSVQPLAYYVDLDVSLAVSGGATWVAGNIVNLQARVVDSAVTEIGASTNVRFRSEATASQTIIENRRIRFRVPASHAAVTWKVQARQAAASPTGLTGSVVSAGASLPAPTASYQPYPTLLTATTVA